MQRRRVSDDEWQYRERSSAEVRGTLLALTLEFVRAARVVRGVTRIAMLGSLVTDKARPKDSDLLVSVAEDVDWAPLARLSRRLQGRAQGINSTADVFLAAVGDVYVGRVCRYRECHPRIRCRARHCGRWPHLNDDLDVVALAPDLLRTPPLVLHPAIEATVPLPADVESLLLAPLRFAGMLLESRSRMPAKYPET